MLRAPSDSRGRVQVTVAKGVIVNSTKIIVGKYFQRGIPGFLGSDGCNWGLPAKVVPSGHSAQNPSMSATEILRQLGQVIAFFWREDLEAACPETVPDRVCHGSRKGKGF